MVFANIFQPLIDVFGPVLVFLHGVIGGSWGWSIIALTVVVRAVLLPLAFRQMRSLQKLQRVAPQTKAIQAKYRGDKQRRQRELVKFYKENDVNPFASFLPLVAQLPVFVGLYYTLRTRLREDICPGLQAAFRHAYAAHHQIPLHQAAGRTVACHGLNGSSWLFIHDLTSTAGGLTLVVLIVLYVGTQLASSLMMRAPAMDQTQRWLLLVLPLLFVILIVEFPAGLILYWITTNVWTMGQQWVIRRRLGPVGPVAPAAPGPSPGGRDGRRAAAAGNAAGGGGGPSGARRGTPEPGDKQPVAVGSSTRARRQAPPRPPPRKNRKRSGRRR
jgi:YidC/Oxa1 family membrane protein insertase